MENSDVVQSIIMGLFLLAIIIPLAFLAWEMKKENDRLDDAKSKKNRLKNIKPL